MEFLDYSRLNPFFMFKNLKEWFIKVKKYYPKISFYIKEKNEAEIYFDIDKISFTRESFFGYYF
jgi:hypothetical protein